MERDAKKAASPFTFHQNPGRATLEYTYHGATHGRGEIRLGDCGRVFVIEASSSRNEGLQGPQKRASSTFVSGEDPELWSVLNLAFRLPGPLDVERQEFLAGRTRLTLKSKVVHFTADRWAFADQLLKAHGLETWARALLRAETAVATETEHGLELVTEGTFFKPPSIALIQHQIEANQLVLLESKSRSNLWRPQWNWFES